MTNNRLSEAKRPLAERTRSNVISISAYKRNTSSLSLINHFLVLRYTILNSDCGEAEKNRLRAKFKNLTLRMVEKGNALESAKADELDSMIIKFASFFKPSNFLNSSEFGESLAAATMILFNALNKRDGTCY